MFDMCTRQLTVVAMIAVGSVSLAAQNQGAPSGGGSIAGVVRYAGGEPLADVRVTLLVPGTTGGRSSWSTRTGVDGAYRFADVAAAEYQISVSHAGAVAQRITMTPQSALKDIDFFIPNGSQRVVTGRVIMNDASKHRQIPARIGMRIIMRADSTFVLPLQPGDQRVNIRLPEGYFLDSATYGQKAVYSLKSVGGRRLPGANVAITVPPEPDAIPELVITLGSFR